MAGGDDLHGAVHQVPDENGPVTAGHQPRHRRARCVPGSRLQREEVIDAVGALPEQGLPGAVNGRDAVLVDQAVGRLPAVTVPWSGP